MTLAADRPFDGPAVEALLEWARGYGRDLPWRHSRDPWRVLLSEVMTQQTQVGRVAPRWVEFCEQYPTPAALASASLGDVLRGWAGLGYPRRARDLHRAAALMVQRHGGAVPDDLAELLGLPGVGPYTARAVLAFAFERDVAVVDTNVGRILARRLGRCLRPSEAQRVADASLPTGRAWSWNQAVLDLGATVCTARRPDCSGCPVSAQCLWRGVGGPDPARGSAMVSRPQSRFEGSDRQGRGRLLALLAAGPVHSEALAEAAGWSDDPARAARILDQLLAEGLATRTVEGYSLP